MIAAAPTLNAKRDEKAAHEHFLEFRVIGEFFDISEQTLHEYFSKVLTQTYHEELDVAVNALHDE